MTRRSVFAVIGGFFLATKARGQQEVPRNEEANVMFNQCVMNKGYELNPQECQECGAEFVYLREQPKKSQRPNFCPNCGGKNVGIHES
jgi:hypothetical protein